MNKEINFLNKKHSERIIKDLLRGIIKEGYFEFEGKDYKIEEIEEGHDRQCEGTMCYCASRRK